MAQTRGFEFDEALRTIRREEMSQTFDLDKVVQNAVAAGADQIDNRVAQDRNQRPNSITEP